MEIIITDQLTESTIKKLLSFVRTQSQYYPNFNEWVDGKLTQRLMNWDYRSIVAISNNEIVGNAIYSESDNSLQIKNFRIDKEYRNLHLGSLILSQMKILDKPIFTDITVNNFSAVKFFIKNNFDILSVENLYSGNQLEYQICYQ